METNAKDSTVKEKFLLSKIETVFDRIKELIEDNFDENVCQSLMSYMIIIAGSFNIKQTVEAKYFEERFWNFISDLKRFPGIYSCDYQKETNKVLDNLNQIYTPENYNPEIISERKDNKATQTLKKVIDQLKIDIQFSSKNMPKLSIN